MHKQVSIFSNCIQENRKIYVAHSLEGSLTGTNNNRLVFSQFKAKVRCVSAHYNKNKNVSNYQNRLYSFQLECNFMQCKLMLGEVGIICLKKV